MYRPRDITDSIATAAIIIILVATLAIGAISFLGIKMPDIGSGDRNFNTSSLDPLFHTPFGFDFQSMDPASKIIFGSLTGLIIFLVIILGWVYWYRYRGRNK